MDRQHNTDMDDVQAVKQTYVIALENEEDTSMVVHTLIHADCPLSDKYQIISMDSLIGLNNQVIYFCSLMFKLASEL